MIQMTTIKYRENKLGRLRKGVEKKPPVTGFPAKYAGTCIICKKAIEVGQSIRKYDYGKAYHIECI
jgi:hypothetical protein